MLDETHFRNQTEGRPVNRLQSLILGLELSVFAWVGLYVLVAALL